MACFEEVDETARRGDHNLDAVAEILAYPQKRVDTLLLSLSLLLLLLITTIVSIIIVNVSCMFR